MKDWLFTLAGTVLCLIIAISCSNDHGSSLVGDPDRLVEFMRADALVVKEGVMKNVNIIEACCDPAKLMPMCYGNNVGAPYLVTYLPEADGQKVMNSSINYLGFPPPPSSVGIGKSRSFRFGETEAIVIVGRTPPAASVYFSYISYVTLRCTSANCFPDAAPVLTQDYQRRFASMVNALNNENIRTTGTPGGKSGDSFDKDTMIIITADRETDRRVRRAAASAGYSDLIMNTIIVPAEFVRFGIDYGKDEIGIIHRLANWDDTYISNPPARVFRVSSGATPDPFPAPPFTPRGGKQTPESVIYKDAVAALRNAILSKYSTFAVTEYDTSRWIPEGLDCLAGDVNNPMTGYDCLGDNHDGLYFRMPDLAGGKPSDLGHTFSLINYSDDFIIVYGVNHTKSGFALYSSVTTYRHAMLNGGNTTWNKDYEGSAVNYLKGTLYEDKSDKLYVLRIARSCAGVVNEPCMEFPDCAGCPDNCKPECRTTGANDLFLGIRAYLEPGTGVGPSYDEVIWDKAIHFKK